MNDEPWDGPTMPPVDPEAAAQFREWQEDNALPAIFLEADGPAPDGPDGSRIGGPVWLAEGESWPASSKGEPMVFVAQVDFGHIGKLLDESGRPREAWCFVLVLGYSRKMVVRLQAAAGNDAPHLLMTSFDAGHGIGSSIDQLVEQNADGFAFLLRYVTAK